MGVLAWGREIDLPFLWASFPRTATPIQDIWATLNDCNLCGRTCSIPGSGVGERPPQSCLLNLPWCCQPGVGMASTCPSLKHCRALDPPHAHAHDLIGSGGQQQNMSPLCQPDCVAALDKKRQRSRGWNSEAENASEAELCVSPWGMLL